MAQEQPGASDDTASACESMPYHETTDRVFGQHAASTFVASEATDDTISLVGSCPRCLAGMEVVIPSVMFLANRTGRLRGFFKKDDKTPTAGKEQNVPMICLCPAPHPGRPQDRKGCGAYWNLTVKGQT
ncbi:hypothetical protein [Streptomyces sp. NPDC127036]|uniref:hypothetical protein n=1 Tax=Streptomyces sp. NPDC127036 TaxID=3347112 RepID=UPI003668E652